MTVARRREEIYMIRLVLVGAGSRGTQYVRHALRLSEQDEGYDVKMVGVVDPDISRRAMAADNCGVPDSGRFSSVEELIASGLPFDAAFNTTMDAQHFETVIPLLRAGKHVLLEKPICLSRDELMTIYDEARAAGTVLMICHGMRYDPFYMHVKNRILSGDIGTVKHIYASEAVGQSHMAAAFIRGKWGNSELCGSKILMAKCCHDLDMLTWMKSGVRPVAVSSFGSLFEYRPEMAREGAAEKCLSCPIAHECPYDAKLCYIDRTGWGVYAWRAILDKGSDLQGKTIPLEEKLKYLEGDDRFGRCVYHLDNDQFDTQTLNIRFEDGTHATFGLNCGTPYATRYLRVEGTRGVIDGSHTDHKLTIRLEAHDPEHEFTEEIVDVDPKVEIGDSHGGNDTRLVRDFLNTLLGRPRSNSCTSIEDSMYGHLLGFGAIDAAENESVVRIENLLMR